MWNENAVLRRCLHVVAVALAVVPAPACADEPPQVRHPDESVQIDTAGASPVVALSDLGKLGFDSTTMQTIAPEVAPLNSALLVLAALKRSYDATTSKEERGRLNTAAVPYHVSADRQQRSILLSLQPPLDSLFDRYVEERKRLAGLDDWHPDHREERPTEVPGLVRPPAHRPH